MNEFQKYRLPFKGSPYEQLYYSVQFENIGNRRLGTVLVAPDENRGVPIVRTTTRYSEAASKFKDIHQDISELIKSEVSISQDFNNALIEHYTDNYAKMGFHSDQALDLEEGTMIALFSCYKHPDQDGTRKLIVGSKDSGDQFEVCLEQNSAVVFSLETNKRFKHKIVLDRSKNIPENHWLGITFRTSKTFVQYRNNRAFFESREELTLATKEECSEYFPLRGQENREIDFSYPSISYTISRSDLLPPV